METRFHWFSGSGVLGTVQIVNFHEGAVPGGIVGQHLCLDLNMKIKLSWSPWVLAC